MSKRGIITTLSPRDIIFPMEQPIAKDDLVRKFVLNGYGTKRARYWIREFINLGLIFEDNGVLDVEPIAKERYRS